MDMDESDTQQPRPTLKRPPPLKIPARMPIIMEIPEDMIEWHGILLPADDCESPVTPSHWTMRIEEPLIKYYYSLVVDTLTIIRNKLKFNFKWMDIQPTEFLPSLYLGSYYDLSKLKHAARVSVLEDFSLIHLLEGDDKNIPINKLEIIAKDDGDTNIMEHFNKIRDFLDKQSEDEIKLIHCVAGMNRSATLAVAYYMHKTQCSLLYALQHMVTLRPIILRNENFLKQLIVWAYDNCYTIVDEDSK